MELAITTHSSYSLQSSQCFFICVGLITMLFATIASIPEHKEAVNAVECMVINVHQANHSGSVFYFATNSIPH